MATSYMVLELPTVSVTLGPQWATSLNDALTLIDAHDHSSDKGVQVTPAGLNINADLDCGSNNLDSVRALRLDNQTSSLVGVSDVSCFYVQNGDAYFKNASGTDIRLTAGGLVNAGSVSTLARSQVAIASNTVIAASDSYTTYLVNTSSARTITLPAANSVSSGRYYIIIDATGTSESNAITIARTGSNTIDGAAGSFTASSNRGTWILESDGVSKWFVTRGSPAALTKSTLTLLAGGSVTIGSDVTLGTSSLTVGASVLSASTLSIGGGLALTATDLVVGTTYLLDGQLTVGGGATLTNTTLTATTATLSGTVTAGTVNTGTLTASDATLTIASGGTLTVASGGVQTVASGGTLALPAGSTFTRGGSAAKVIIDSAYTRLATTFNTSSTTYVTITGLSVNMTCQAGDKLIIDSSFTIQNNASTLPIVKVMITDGGGTIDPNEVRTGNVTNANSNTSMNFTYTVVNSGTVTVYAQLRSNGAGTSYVYGDNLTAGSGAIRVLQYR